MFSLCSKELFKAIITVNGLGVKIRQLGPPDAGAFQSLRLQALLGCPTAFASSYAEEHQTPIAAVAERLHSKPDRCVLGAFIGSRLVGIVGLQREEQQKLAHKAFMWGMYVEPAGRRCGVGRELVAEALARASGIAGVRQVNLGVNASNTAAIALYESLGFSSFGLERGFMLHEGVLHDELHMVCLLPVGLGAQAT